MAEVRFEQPVAFVELVLPNGLLAMQRRTEDAPTSPNKLQFFGGHIEEGETLRRAALRELVEETDLPVNEMEFDEIGLFFVPKKSGTKRVVGLIRSQVSSIRFEDYEGQGTPEAWSVPDLLESEQLVTSVDYLLRNTVRIA